MLPAPVESPSLSPVVLPDRVHPVADRLIALVVVGTALGMILLLASVVPDVRGHGTHESLGLATCSWPLLYEKPCPTCGVTTAAAHLVQLSPWKALKTQPFGAFMAAAGILLAVVGLRTLLFGRPFVGTVALWPYGSIAVAAVVLFLASWLYTWMTFVP